MQSESPESNEQVTETRGTLTSMAAPGQVVARAGTMLRTVKLGLSDMQAADGDRALFGFFGVVVFGRSMTLVMQALRTHDRDAFESWYAPWQEEMKADDLMRYFAELRTTIIHLDSPAIAITLTSFGEGSQPAGSMSVEGVTPPSRHRGELLADTSLYNLCRLYVEYLQKVFDSFAPVAFGVQDRIIASHWKHHAG